MYYISKQRSAPQASPLLFFPLERLSARKSYKKNPCLTSRHTRTHLTKIYRVESNKHGN